MAITFPASPTNGQVFTSGSKSWQWDGTTWISYAANISPSVLKVDATNARVGINNQSPAYALDVNGTIEGTQFLQDTDYLSPYQGFRNKIINGDFGINQRVFTSSTTSGTYGFDRWLFFAGGGTVTYSTQSFTVGSPAATGYEAVKFARLVSASQSASGDFAVLQQRIEDVRTFANSTVTVSFFAKAASGTPKVTVELSQIFGTGGSPSADVNNYVDQVTLSTSWARYSVTINVPNINGKTMGTNSDSALNVNLWTSAGSSFNARLNTLGIQNNTFDIWGVQVERGSVATPFEQRPIGTELALCQRYYYSLVRGATNLPIGMAFYSFSTLVATVVPFPVTMRIAPALVASSGTDYYASVYGLTTDTFNSFTLQYSSTNSAYFYNSTETSGTALQGSVLITNNASASVAFNSEL
jgi:hypothetical protein